MNTDLTDQVHDAFVRRANDVEAPPIDHVAFEAKVGRARTRRRAGSPAPWRRWRRSLP